VLPGHAPKTAGFFVETPWVGRSEHPNVAYLQQADPAVASSVHAKLGRLQEFD
jgi:hypothetical protein